MNPVLLVGTEDRTTAALQETTTTIPTVVIASHDLVQAGFAKTMARPGA